MDQERIIAKQLNEIGQKYWSFWVIAIVLYFVFGATRNTWIAAAFTALLLLLILKMVIPYIGLIYSLGKCIDGFTVPVRNNLNLAILNLIAAAYGIVGVWAGWPYVSVALVFSLITSLVNGSCAGSVDSPNNMR